MNSKNLSRIILGIIIVLCVIQGWWFIALPLAFVCAWMFSSFVELMIAGIVYDSLFGFVKENGLWGYVGTGISVIGFSILAFLKKVTRN
jgi:hypothetical protein